MDLRILHHECDQCGAMIVPPDLISKRGKKIHKVEFVYPVRENTLPNDAFMTVAPYDEIQEGLHDTEPDLVRFKGKPYGQCIGTLQSEYASWRNIRKTEMKDEATVVVSELTSIAKNVTEVEIPDEKTTIEAERYESITEGDEHSGVSKCPVCGFVLVSWKK